VSEQLSSPPRYCPLVTTAAVRVTIADIETTIVAASGTMTATAAK
jgi:hypothetical protein